MRRNSLCGWYGSGTSPTVNPFIGVDGNPGNAAMSDALRTCVAVA